MKKVTISDVAKHANVSKSTVSQYLNKRYEYMSEDTRKKIKSSIEELNFHPNIIARSLKQKSTYTVGVVVANILNSFSTHIISALEKKFQEHGFHIIICNANDEPDKEKNNIDLLMAKQVDGIILFPTGSNITLYDQLLQQNFPLVFIDRKIDKLTVPSVLLDNLHTAKLATTKLLNKGYKNIAILTNPIHLQLTPRIERIEGYRQALLDNNITIKEHYIQSVETTKMQEQLAFLMSLDEKPDAVIATNDRILIEILKFVKANQLRVPTDLAIIGIDDVPLAPLFDPPLTTFSQPAVEMANKAAELLLDQINQAEHTTFQNCYRFEATLNERASY